MPGLPNQTCLIDIPAHHAQTTSSSRGSPIHILPRYRNSKFWLGRKRKKPAHERNQATGATTTTTHHQIRMKTNVWKEEEMVVSIVEEEGPAVATSNNSSGTNIWRLLFLYCGGGASVSEAILEEEHEQEYLIDTAIHLCQQWTSSSSPHTWKGQAQRQPNRKLPPEWIEIPCASTVGGGHPMKRRRQDSPPDLLDEDGNDDNDSFLSLIDEDSVTELNPRNDFPPNGWAMEMEHDVRSGTSSHDGSSYTPTRHDQLWHRPRWLLHDDFDDDSSIGGGW